MADPLFAQSAQEPLTSGAPPSSAPPAMADMVDPKDQKAATDLTNAARDKLKADQGIVGAESKALSQDKERMDRAYAATGVTIDEIGKQSWNADQEMQKREHTPMENFGSLGSIIAIAASAFTHTSAISAFNAAAAYNEAVKNNDNEAYNKAFEGFKENANLMIKRAGLEHERYEDAFKMVGVDMGIANARARAAAASFEDKKALIMLEAGGGLADVMQAKASLGKAVSDIVKEKVAIESGNAKLNYIYENSVIRDENGQPKKDPKTGLVQMDPKKHWEAGLQYDRMESEAKYAGHLHGAHSGAGAVNIPAALEDWRGALGLTEGQPLPQGIDTLIRTAYSAPGTTATAKIAQMNSVLDDIKRRQAAGEQITPEKAEEMLSNVARQSTATPRSGAALFTQKFQQEHPEATSDDIKKANAIYTEAQAAARTLGTRSTNIGVGVREAEGAAKLALKASEAMKRSDFVPWTKMLQEVAKGTSSPEMKEFSVFNRSLITAYAQTMSRNGTNTVAAQRAAEDILSTADGQAAYRRGVKALLQEMDVVHQAVKDVEADALGGGSSSATGPKEGSRKQFKQGWGVWDGEKYVPE